MKQKKKPSAAKPLPPSASAEPSKISSHLESLAALALSATFFFAALLPDEKLNRQKLMVLGGGLILTALFWAIAKAFAKALVIQRTALDPFVLAYAVTAVLYYYFSANPSVAASEFQRMIFSAGGFWAAAQAASGARGPSFRRWIFYGWGGGLFLISIYGTLQRFGGVGRIQVPQLERVFATFGNPIFFAAFLIQSIPFALGLFFESRRFSARLFWFLTLAASSVALFFTGTRAAFLALPASLAVICLWIDFWSGWKWTLGLWARRKTLGIFITLAVLGHFALKAASPAYRSVSTEVMAAIHASRATATQQTHTVIWKDVLRMWKAHPWTGTGYGTFHIEFPQYASDELKRVFPQRERIVNDAHNEFLQILAETGLFGFVVFMALLAAFYFHVLKRLASAVRPKPEGSAPAEDDLNPSRPGFFAFAGLSAGVTALLIQNFFSVDMRFIVSSAYAFLGMGLTLSFFAKPQSWTWPGGPIGRSLKILWAGFFIFASGLIGWRDDAKTFYLAGIWEVRHPESGFTLVKTPAAGPGLFPALVRPYLAQSQLSKAPDFFDEKLLNSAQTIQQLEALVQQYPEQWKYWERLGFSWAKEIQSMDNGQKRINTLAVDRAIAAYERAYQLNPQAEGPPNNLGNIYFTLNRRGEAIQWWQKGIDANPDKIDARLNLGLAFYYEGRIKESARQFEEVLKRDPHNDKAIVMLKRMVE